MTAEEKELLDKLNNEIISLSKDIERIDSKNRKIKFLRLYKKILLIGKIIAPSVIIMSLLFGIFSYFSSTPFFKDNVKRKYFQKKSIDNLGNINYIEQVGAFSDNGCIIKTYSAWSLENGLYERKINVYKIDEDRINDLTALINAGVKDISSLGNPSNELIERKNNIESSELDKKEYIELIVYSELDKFAITKETSTENVLDVLGWLILSLLCISLHIPIFDELNSFYKKNFYSFREINKNNQYINSDLCKKILELKKKNYNRLSSR